MNVINTLLEISIYAAVIYLALLLLKRVLKNRMSPALHYAVWGLLIVRLIMPFTVDSSIRLFVIPDTTPQTEALQSEVQPITAGAEDQIGGTDGLAQTANENHATTATETPPAQPAQAAAVPAPAANKAAIISAGDILPAAWLTGTAAALVYIMVTYVLFRRRIRRGTVQPPQRLVQIFERCRMEMGIRQRVCLKCVYGLGTPALFVPATVLIPMELADSLDDSRLMLALRHELMHYKRRDHILSMLMLALQAIYWFNPFVWLAFRQMRTDMEVACDSAVTKALDGNAKSEYASLIVSMFSAGVSGHLVLGMAQGDSKKVAEKRIRGIFAKSRSKRSAVLAAVMLAVMLAVTCFTTACQPTPAVPVVAAKNAGVMESALAATPAAEPTPYEAPARLTLDVDVPVDNYSIVVDADVVVPDQTAYPVYDVALARFTQEQADAVRLALLEGATLYKPGNVRSRAEVQRSIDYYERELEGSKDYPQLVEDYQKILKNLYAEYEKAPEELTLEEADTALTFQEEMAEAWQYGYTEVPVEDGGIRMEWTDEGREKAIAAGVSSVSGVCWMGSGRKMQFSVRNEENSSSVYFGMDDNNLVQSKCETCTLDQAIEKGNAVLAAVGLDFSLVSTEVLTTISDGEGNMVPEHTRFYSLTYKRNIPGVPLDNIQSVVSQNMEALTGEAAYRGMVPYQETIAMSIDDYGLVSFNWSQPLEITATQSENVPLIPFDTISGRIASQIKIQTMWDEEADSYEAERIASRRLEINKIVLSYLVVAKADDFSSYYLIPVWNVCGDLYYRYKDEYAETSGFVLDENNERKATLQHVFDTSDHSLLTISAIDGTVIPRGMHT